MNDIDKKLEQLFSKASPRPMPEDTATAREAIRQEWQAVSGQYQSRKKILRFAVAATVLIGLFSIFNGFRVAEPEWVKVASIQKSFGSIYILGEQSQLTRADDLAAIHAGQVIVTGDDAGIAMAWSGGGSVRLHKNTEVEFRDDNTVFLRSGQIYFDSTPSELIAGVDAAGVASFQIETEYGTVSHVGTQFMTEVGSHALRVSVREGRVDVAGRFYPHVAERGEQVLLSGRQRPVVLNFPEYGAAWDWVAQTSPSVDIDGKSVHAFLNWVGRELGMSIQYGSDDIEQVARQAILEGRVDSEPGEALRLRMLTAALEWRYEPGVIYVSESN
jgi:hypothetical protein